MRHLSDTGVTGDGARLSAHASSGPFLTFAPRLESKDHSKSLLLVKLWIELLLSTGFRYRLRK